MVCIQKIGVHWTKATRGGMGATLRSRIPDAMPFSAPLAPSVAVPYLVQTVEYTNFAFNNDDSKIFQPRLQLPANLDSFDFRGVSALLVNSSLDVQYEYKWEQGMPWRYSTTNEVARLQVGQWCRVSFNGRFSSYRYTAHGEGNGWYEKWVINIGLFSEPSPEIFLKTEPIKVYSRLAMLF